MSTPETTTTPQPREDTTERNFRMLEAKYEKQLAQERAARQEAERLAQEALKKQQQLDDDDDSEPYVDQRKLQKTLNKFGEQTKQQTQAEIRNAVQEALAQERQQNWIKANPDFFDTMQHADKLAQMDPELADSILAMPDNFERQKLVYKNIKALNLHKPPEPASTIQSKVDANRRSPYYQPSGVANAPYSSQSDYSPQGQEQAYKKMKELQAKLRLG